MRPVFCVVYDEIDKLGGEWMRFPFEEKLLDGEDVKDCGFARPWWCRPF